MLFRKHPLQRLDAFCEKHNLAFYVASGEYNNDYFVGVYPRKSDGTRDKLSKLSKTCLHDTLDLAVGRVIDDITPLLPAIKELGKEPAQ